MLKRATFSRVIYQSWSVPKKCDRNSLSHLFIYANIKSDTYVEQHPGFINWLICGRVLATYDCIPDSPGFLCSLTIGKLARSSLPTKRPLYELRTTSLTDSRDSQLEHWQPYSHHLWWVQSTTLNNKTLIDTINVHCITHHLYIENAIVMKHVNIWKYKKVKFVKSTL